jgi:hypothetical protein
MLKLQDYNKSRIVVSYKDCNSINLDRVQSIVLSRVDDISCIDISTTIVTYNRENSLSFLKGDSIILEYDNLNFFDFTSIEVKIYLTNNYIIDTSSIGSNVILGSSLLNDFTNSTQIKIDSTTYVIDKDYSTLNELTLTTPLISTNSSYQVITSELNYLFPLKALIEKSRGIISDLNCSDCIDIDKETRYVIRFMGLQTAVKCSDKQKALTLFNELKTC